MQNPFRKADVVWSNCNKFTMASVVITHCVIDGRGGVESCGKITTGQSLVAHHCSEEDAGWLPKEVAEVLVPMMNENLFETISSFATTEMG